MKIINLTFLLSSASITSAVQTKDVHATRKDNHDGILLRGAQVMLGDRDQKLEDALGAINDSTFRSPTAQDSPTGVNVSGKSTDTIPERLLQDTTAAVDTFQDSLETTSEVEFLTPMTLTVEKFNGVEIDTIILGNEESGNSDSEFWETNSTVTNFTKTGNILTQNVEYDVDEDSSGSTIGDGDRMLVSVSSDESYLASRVQHERTTRGLQEIYWSNDIVVKAQNWAAYMVRTGNFRHSSLKDGVQSGYKRIAENIAWNKGHGSRAVEVAHQGLMDSPGHRANILNGSYNRIGVGISKRSDGAVFVCQVFKQV